MTNWEYLMGTPGLAAHFLAKVSGHCNGDLECDENCPLCGERIECGDYQQLRAWLESEMD